MSQDEEADVLELPQMWQFIHPHYNEETSDESDDEETETTQPKGVDRDYVKLSKRAPHLGKLLRYLNNFEDIEDLQQLLLQQDPVTQQSLLQWATLNNHYLLVEYLVKRLQRDAFAFDPESDEIITYNRWEEMRPELPTAAEVAENQKRRDQEKTERMAQLAQWRANGDEEEFEEEEEEEEAAEPTPAKLVYDSLEEFHEEWGDRGVGLVKRVGELGVYLGSRLRDGTKEGLGQTLFPNGDCYAGEYRCNERSGKGTYWWSQSGALYCGDWVNNMRHGYGRLAYPDGSRYLGHWTKDMKNGQGRYTYADGSSYDGMWVDNEKHGQGRYSFTDGASYVGSFYHNEFVSGEWWLACGTVRYIGNFVKDVPVGAGVFVHRCGLKPGSFQQEGVYRDGRWFSGSVKGSTKVVPHLRVMVPEQKENAQVPLVFVTDAACKRGYGMPDLAKVANFGPLVRWLHKFAETSSEPNKIILKKVEVVSIVRDQCDPGRIISVRIRPLLVDAHSTRINPQVSEEEAILTLSEPLTRLLLLLLDGEKEPLVLLQQAAPSAKVSQDEAKRCELPSVRWTPDGRIEGDVLHTVVPALRLSVSKRTIRRLVQSTEAPNAAQDEVWLYAQQLHSNTICQIQEKLQCLPAYSCVPLSAVLTMAPDDSTREAISQVEQLLCEATKASVATALPQRPPTPIPPPAKPRPDMQPLYDAEAMRQAAAEKED